MGNLDIFYEKLDELFDILQNINKKAIVLGDFNVDMQVSNPSTFELNNILLSHNFKNNVNFATRVKNSSSTIIDHCYTNISEHVKIDVNKNTLSDHYGIELTQNCKEITIPKIDFLKRKYLNETLAKKLSERLTLELWKNVYECTGTNTKYSAFRDILLDHLNQIIPVKKCKTQKDNSLSIKDDTTIALTEEIRLFEELLNNKPNDQNYKESLSKSKAKLKTYIDTKIRMQNSTSINKATNKAKELWNIVYKNINKGKDLQSITGLYLQGDDEVNDDGGIDTHDSDNVLCQDPTVMSKMFNTYFTEAPTKLINSIDTNDLKDVESFPTFENSNSNNNSMFFAPTCKKEVMSVITHLKNSKAYDIDNVSTHIIKTISEYIAEPLSHIYNNALEEGVFPDELKIGKVIPVFKKGDPFEISNYRPISILPIISKVFEQLTLIRLNNFLDTSGILNNSQHGFRKKLSTITAAFELIEKIHTDLENKLAILSVFIDLSKAFDLVDHIILLYKMHKMGIRGVANDFFRSYLANRKQHVQVNSKNGTAISSSQSVLTGVPQGSILGPILYLMYVNDFTAYIDEFTIMYADDTSMVFTGQNVNDVKEKAINTITNTKIWFSCHKLLMNDGKTNVMYFNKQYENNQIQLELETCTLNSANTTKFLGLYLDNELNWSTHITKLSNKLSSSLFALRVVKNKMEPFSLMQVYHAIFESHIRYGIIFWGSSLKTNVNKVLLIQKKAVRILASLKYRESCRETFIKLEIMTVISLYVYDILLFVKNNLALLNQDTVTHTHNTRAKQTFVRPFKHRTKLYEQSVSYSGLKLYNSLPIKIKELEFPKYKKILKDFFIKNPLYTLDEYYDILPELTSM